MVSVACIGIFCNLNVPFLSVIVLLPTLFTKIDAPIKRDFFSSETIPQTDIVLFSTETVTYLSSKALKFKSVFEFR